MIRSKAAVTVAELGDNYYLLGKYKYNGLMLIVSVCVMIKKMYSSI